MSEPVLELIDNIINDLGTLRYYPTSRLSSHYFDKLEEIQSDINDILDDLEKETKK